MLRFDRGTGELNGFLITETCFNPQEQESMEAIFCQGNGYLGQRAACEEAYVHQTRNLFVAGTFDQFHESEVTELPNFPDFINLSLTLDGSPFSLESGELLSYQRDLNLRTGEMRRDVLWRSPTGHRYQLVFRRFVSLAWKHTLAFCTEITALDAPCRLNFDSGIDATVTNSGTQHWFEGRRRLLDGRILHMEQTTLQSGVTCNLYAAHLLKVDNKPIAYACRPEIHRRYLGEHVDLSLALGRKVSIEKLCLVQTSRDLDAMDGVIEMHALLASGYEAQLCESTAAWTRWWENSDIIVKCNNPYDQVAIRFALYHLNIMAPKGDDRIGIGAKGLSGEVYKGHSFWDTEIFIFPFFLFTQPETARNLLGYRYRLLPVARKKASDHGYQGVMFPWEAAWSSDGEVTPKWAGTDIVNGKPIPVLTGELEQHITADIAYAVWQYEQVTGDYAFMESKGREILLESARFWASRVAWNPVLGAYEILDIIGPDEYKEHVDNNAYTNYMAQFVLALTWPLTRNKQLREVAEKLYLPQPGEDGLIPQIENYFTLQPIDLTPYRQAGQVGSIFNDYNQEQINRLQVSKQADLLLLMLLLEDHFDADVLMKNFKYYESRTMHDSSLSKSTHCILAQDLGLWETAYHFFEGACAIDLPKTGPLHSKEGIHSASMGGIWQCAVFGFGGVRIRDGELHISPKLPVNWEQLTFRLVWQDQTLWVNIDSSTVQVENHGTQPVNVYFNGSLHVLEAL